MCPLLRATYDNLFMHKFGVCMWVRMNEFRKWPCNVNTYIRARYLPQQTNWCFKFFLYQLKTKNKSDLIKVPLALSHANRNSMVPSLVLFISFFCLRSTLLLVVQNNNSNFLSIVIYVYFQCYFCNLGYKNVNL